MQDKDIQALKALAEKADKMIVRSHGWPGTVEGFDALQTDEQYLLAAEPRQLKLPIKDK